MLKKIANLKLKMLPKEHKFLGIFLDAFYHSVQNTASEETAMKIFTTIINKRRNSLRSTKC